MLPVDALAFEDKSLKKKNENFNLNICSEFLSEGPLRNDHVPSFHPSVLTRKADDCLSSFQLPQTPRKAALTHI